jgi:putative ABC transport system ATP-binding protein
MENNILIQANNIVKKYHRGSEEVTAVNNVSVDIKKGEFVSFIGPSGSGKTTLINILGCLDNPSSGMLTIADKIIFSGNKILSEGELTAVRREFFGYIFQSFYLIPTLNVYENTVMPFAFYNRGSTEKDVMSTLDMLGLKNRMTHLPSELSGGEMQRVAIARALVNKPQILLADEPTGNLDLKRTGEISTLLKQLNTDMGLTIIMVTHNIQLAEKADRVIRLIDGILQ